MTLEIEYIIFKVTWEIWEYAYISVWIKLFHAAW